MVIKMPRKEGIEKGKWGSVRVTGVRDAKAHAKKMKDSGFIVHKKIHKCKSKKGIYTIYFRHKQLT